MKKITRLSTAHALIGIVLCSMLFAFSFKPGAHSFQIYLDSKLMADQYVSSKTSIPKLILNPAENANHMIIKYNECGRTVTGRTMTIRDDKNSILKEWHFEGSSTGYKESMTLNVKDILALRQKTNSGLGLYYSSNDFQHGQLIATLVIGGEEKAALNR